MGLRLNQLAAILAGSAALDSDAMAWASAAETAGGAPVSGGTLSAVSAFVKSCKDAGIWDSLTAVNLAAGPNLAASLVSVKGANATGTGMSGSDFSEALGWATDGSTKYLRTGTTPSTGLGGLAAYLRTTQASDTNGRNLIGGQSTGSALRRICGNRDANFSASAGTVTGAWLGQTNAPISVSGGLVAGFWHVSRTALNAAGLYLNGTPVGTSAGTVTNAGAVDIWVMALNNNGSAANLLESGSRVAGYVIDTGLDATQAAALNTIMQSFQAALGRQV